MVRMGYVVGHGLQNPEMKFFISTGHSVAEILNVKSGKSTTFLIRPLINYANEN